MQSDLDATTASHWFLAHPDRPGGRIKSSDHRLDGHDHAAVDGAVRRALIVRDLEHAGRRSAGVVGEVDRVDAAIAAALALGAQLERRGARDVDVAVGGVALAAVADVVVLVHGDRRDPRAPGQCRGRRAEDRGRADADPAVAAAPTAAAASTATAASTAATITTTAASDRRALGDRELVHLVMRWPQDSRHVARIRLGERGAHADVVRFRCALDLDAIETHADDRAGAATGRGAREDRRCDYQVLRTHETSCPYQWEVSADGSQNC